MNINPLSICSAATNLAKRAQENFHLSLFDNKYSPILFVGKEAKEEQKGVYTWKLRKELYEALTEFGIDRFNPRNDFNQNNSVAEACTSDNQPYKFDIKGFPKNIILFCPPGTGKTYNSIANAEAIIKKDKFRLLFS